MKQLVPLIIMFVLAGCKTATTVTSIKVDTTSKPPVATFMLSDTGINARTINARLFAKYESTQVIALPHQPEQTGDYSYRMMLPALPPNQYRLVIEMTDWRHFLGIPIGKSTQRFTHDFIIHNELPQSCFVFDTTANDTMGWTSRGVYINNQPERISADTCPGLFYTNVSWPHTLNEPSQGGSLFVPVSNECFPRTAPQTSEPGMWHFSIVSPDMSQREEWQGLSAIQFKMATKTIPVIVVPEIEYQLADQTYGTHESGKPQPRYQVSNGRWGNITHPLQIPQGARIRHVRLHVYGQPEQTVSEKVDSIFLDAICPIK